MTTIVLLTISNIFMTFAWYGHLKYRHAPLFKVIVISWGIAFFEYCFQVPANRIGSYEFSAVQLKTIQEVITLTVFSVFSVFYLDAPIKWNYILGLRADRGGGVCDFQEMVRIGSGDQPGKSKMLSGGMCDLGPFRATKSDIYYNLLPLYTVTAEPSARNAEVGACFSTPAKSFP